MNPDAHAAARCQNGANCTGTGCRLHTGKTKRKNPSSSRKGKK